MAHMTGFHLDVKGREVEIVDGSATHRVGKAQERFLLENFVNGKVDEAGNPCNRDPLEVTEADLEALLGDPELDEEDELALGYDCVCIGNLPMRRFESSRYCEIVFEKKRDFNGFFQAPGGLCFGLTSMKPEDLRDSPALSYMFYCPKSYLLDGIGNAYANRTKDFEHATPENRFLRKDWDTGRQFTLPGKHLALEEGDRLGIKLESGFLWIFRRRRNSENHELLNENRLETFFKDDTDVYLVCTILGRIATVSVDSTNPPPDHEFDDSERFPTEDDFGTTK